MQLKTYEFPFGLTLDDLPIVLDDDGHEQHQRPATDADLGGDGEETSPSEHIMKLVDQEQDRWPSLDQRSALERVRKKNPELFRLYASESAGRLRVY